MEVWKKKMWCIKGTSLRLKLQFSHLYQQIHLSTVDWIILHTHTHTAGSHSEGLGCSSSVQSSCLSCGLIKTLSRKWERRRRRGEDSGDKRTFDYLLIAQHVCTHVRVWYSSGMQGQNSTAWRGCYWMNGKWCVTRANTVTVLCPAVLLWLLWKTLASLCAPCLLAILLFSPLSLYLIPHCCHICVFLYCVSSSSASHYSRASSQ